jgi:hypothetical protein
VDHRQGPPAIRRRHGLGKEHGILVILRTQIDAVQGGEAHQAQAAPVP